MGKFIKLAHGNVKLSRKKVKPPKGFKRHGKMSYRGKLYHFYEKK